MSGNPSMLNFSIRNNFPISTGSSRIWFQLKLRSTSCRRRQISGWSQVNWFALYCVSKVINVERVKGTSNQALVVEPGFGIAQEAIVRDCCSGGTAR